MVACTRDAPAPPTLDPGAGEASRVLAGWMGAFGRQAPEVAAVLADPRWGSLRDMDLDAAAASFAGDPERGPRIGLARAYLYLADLAEALDGAFLDAEDQYLRAAGGAPKRRSVVALRRGTAGAPPVTLEAAGPEADLGAALAYLGVQPGASVGPGPVGQAVVALDKGEPGRALAALAGIDLGQPGSGAGPELAYYPLLRRAFGALAARALREPASAAEAFLAGRAAEHRGDRAGAEAWYGRGAGGTDGLPPFLFSPFLDAADLAEVGAVRRAGALGLRPEGWAGVGALARAEALILLPDLAVEEETVVGSGEFGEGDPAVAMAALYSARTAAVAQRLARAHWVRGSDDRALEVLEGARRRGAGARPDFRNPPAFLADLARGYARTGAYAPAVAVLFDLSARFRSATLCYESLKRLYAFRSGGEVPPR